VLHGNQPGSQSLRQSRGAEGRRVLQKLVAEAGDSSGNPEEVERPPLEAATKHSRESSD
jgi:hypothetical protein